jgi:tetratricopeptide (TPR) repeat protein
VNGLKQLVREIHRRSLWQVLGIFLAASWGVLQVVEVLTETAGLPDWTPSMALVLLLIGVPVVLATAIVQEGMPGQTTGTDQPGQDGTGDDGAAPEPVNLAEGTGSLDRPSSRPSRTARLFTWKNAILGGVGAFALLGFSLVAYFVMWSAGIGPVGNLQAQGVIEQGDVVLLADFRNTTGDAALGDVVTEALRVDLATAQAITLVEESAAREILARMNRPDEAVRGTVADEVAVRGGSSAIIEGEVGAAGSGYILTATIRSAQDGSTLATFRRTAADQGSVIAAIDGLSQDIRERVGESLRSIRAGEPLEQVTTPSLPALRLYTEARAVSETGDQNRAQELLREALRIDPEFAMAWRALAVTLSNTGAGPAETRHASTRAYELRNRLTERERYQATAYYHRDVTGDLFAEIAAYQTVLDAYPDDRAALNNLAIAYSNLARWEDAAALLDRAVGGPGASFSAYANRPLYDALGGDFEAARRSLADLEARYPGTELWGNWGGWVLAMAEWDADEALRRGAAVQQVPDGASWRRTGTRAVALSYSMTGQMGAAREAMRGAVTEAERAEAWTDAAQAWVDLAKAELLVGSGDPVPPLRELLARGTLERIPPQFRSNFDWIQVMAWAGLEEEARRMLAEWESASGGLEATLIRHVSRVAEAFLLGFEDPAAGAAAIQAIRSDTQCERCLAWELGELYERAGMRDAAMRERQLSLEAGQNFWFGPHRLAAHEALGRLYEQNGQLDEAREHYTIYVQQLADGTSLPRVAAARERLAVLQTVRLVR